MRDRREREETKRREEKVRGTAQESFSHEAQNQQKQCQSPHTVRTVR